jgi:hypothetical protein
MIEVSAGRPDFAKLDWKNSSFLSIATHHPELFAWANEATKEALRIMRERRGSTDTGGARR